MQKKRKVKPMIQCKQPMIVSQNYAIHMQVSSRGNIYITLCSHDSDRMKCKQYVISNKRCSSRFM